jgi:hypothetical protein
MAMTFPLALKYKSRDAIAALVGGIFELLFVRE